MLLPLFVAFLAILVPYLFRVLYYKRVKQYAIFPQLPTSLILGHLKVVDGFIRRGKPNGHPDLTFAAINETLGRPPLMFLDLRPAGPAMVIVRSHEVAETISKGSKLLPYGLPKMPEVSSHIVDITGPNSILNAEGEDWKLLRRRFNPGFAPSYLLTTFLGCILEKSFTFLDHLNTYSRTGQSFSLVYLTGNLTFDIISSVVMDADFGAQNMDNPSEFVRVYHELFQTYVGEQMDLPWFFTFRTRWKRQKLAERIKDELKAIVCNEFARRQTEPAKSRSILSLSLQNITNLTEQAIDEACDQLRTFLFAGHDTTGILLSWVFYELSRTPHALRAVRDELNDLFGPEEAIDLLVMDSDPHLVRDKLLSDGGQDLLGRMTYVNAVIKEALRLWPPAGTARITKPGAGLTVNTPAGEFLLEGVRVYNCAIMIQRDPDVYGSTANDFIPERWLGEAAEKIPTTAWRAFERGPRNCIGQELATLEARVVLALVARHYDFVKVGLGEVSLDAAGEPITDTKGCYKAETEMYPTRQVTPKPVDGMMMRVVRK